MNGVHSDSKRSSLREIRFTYSSEWDQATRDRMLVLLEEKMVADPCAGCFPSCAHVYTVIDENFDCWCVGELCPGTRVKECP